MISDKEKDIKKKLFGSIGMVIGLLALFVAVGSPYIIEKLEPPTTFEDDVAGIALKLKDKIKKSIIKGKVENTVVQKSEPKVSQYIPMISLGLGLVGIMFGVIALINSEDRFIAGTSVALGGSAIIAQYTIILTGALIVALIVSAILFQLDLI